MRVIVAPPDSMGRGGGSAMWIGNQVRERQEGGEERVSTVK